MLLKPGYLLVGALAVALGSAAVGRSVIEREADGEGVLGVAVRRGDLEIGISTIGTLIAPRSVTIASEVESNRAKIVKLAPEGTAVVEGDLLIAFDRTPFVEEQTKLSRLVQEAEANHLEAEQNLKLLEVRARQQRTEAERRLRLAQIDLETRAEGGEPIRARELRARLERSAQQLQEVEQAYKDSAVFLAEGFITRKEHARQEAEWNEARRSHELAQAAYQNQQSLQQPADLERARIAVKRAEEDVARADEQTAEEAKRQEAVVKRAVLALEAARSDLDRASEQLSKTEIRAPASGLLVYNEIAVGSERRRVQVGDSVWIGQPIMTIPDTSVMAVDTTVREFDIHQVVTGQSARVSLDALPDLRLEGRVDFIGNLATGRQRSTGQKEFALRLVLQSTDERLRPGMTARVDIDVERREGVLLLPIESVFERKGETYCYLTDGDTTVERRVRVGRSNLDQVEIVEGLEEGDVVSLAPRESRSWLWGS